MEKLIPVLWFVFFVSILLYACVDRIKDNERGAAFWLFGWYGSILRPGLVFKLPFAKIYRHTIAPRENRRESGSFITEPAEGFLVKTDLDVVVMFDPDTTDIKDFIKFHQVQDGLEKNVWIKIKNFIDDKIRHAKNPTSDTAKTDDIKQAAEDEGHRFIKEYSGAGKIAFEDGWLKLDIDDEARVAVQAPKIQELYNKQQQLAQNKFDEMVEQTRGEDKEMTRKEAVITVLNRMDKTANMSDQTWNIPGLTGVAAEIFKKIAQKEAD